MLAQVTLYDRNKYSDFAQKINQITSTVTGIDVREIPEEELEKEFGADKPEKDEYDSYFILHCKDSGRKVFGFSRADVYFI